MHHRNQFLLEHVFKTESFKGREIDQLCIRRLLRLTDKGNERTFEIEQRSIR